MRQSEDWREAVFILPKTGGYMALYYRAKTAKNHFPCACVICSVELRPRTATAGQFDRNNIQTFACISHFSEIEKLISGWAEFMTRERLAAEHDLIKLHDFTTGSAHA